MKKKSVQAQTIKRKNDYLLESIEVGKNTGRPLDPSDIEFTFLRFGKVYPLDEDGCTDYSAKPHLGVERVTHTFLECSDHHLKSEEVTDEHDIKAATIMSLGTELSDIIYVLSQYGAYQLYELVVEDLERAIRAGYQTIEQYDWRDDMKVEENE